MLVVPVICLSARNLTPVVGTSHDSATEHRAFPQSRASKGFLMTLCWLTSSHGCVVQDVDVRALM
jgi:hypothetical protein